MRVGARAWCVRVAGARVCHWHAANRYHKLPPSLRKRVTTYFEALWDRHRLVGSGRTALFIKKLNEPLALEVQLFMNRDMIAKVPIFSKCDKNVIVQLVRALQFNMYMPG